MKVDFVLDEVGVSFTNCEMSYRPIPGDMIELANFFAGKMPDEINSFIGDLVWKVLDCSMMSPDYLSVALVCDEPQVFVNDRLIPEWRELLKSLGLNEDKPLQYNC